MRRWLPFPLVSLALLALWLVLNQTLDPTHVALGALLAWGGGFALAGMEPPRPSRPRVGTIATLFVHVFADIVQSNFAVARLVINPRRRGRRAGFLDIPLELSDPRGLAVLACIVTATPGTNWARYDRVRGVLTLHVLDLRDASAVVRTFKRRYEQPLIEVFQ